jgi:hypothetical protein
VDLLLLTGDVWSADGSDYRAAVALQTGCQRLADAGISVIIHVREQTTFHRGLCGVKLPESVALLADLGVNDWAWERAGTAAAIFRSVRSRQHAGSGHPEGSVTSATQDAFKSLPRIGLLESPDCLYAGETSLSVVGGESLDPAVDYIADGCHLRQRTVRLGTNTIHCPGPAQGLSPHEAGPCGCTLVEWDGPGEVRLTTLPVAPLRWEQWHVELSGEDGSDQLLPAMLRTISESTQDQAACTWLVSWNLCDCDLPVDLWQTPEGQSALLRELDRRARDRGVSLCSQGISLLSTGSPLRIADPVWDEFDRLLSENVEQRRDAVRLLASGMRFTDEAGRAAAAKCLNGLSPVRLAQEARVYGRNWLGTHEATDR